MKDVSLVLTADEANAILNVLGELPTKTGAFTLLLKIKNQIDAQMKDNQDEPTE
jgi:hypothetical protein